MEKNLSNHSIFCEKYTIDNLEGDSTAFIIDEDGLLVSIGSFGNYIYKWGEFANINDFKKFLIESEMSYIYEKIIINNRVVNNCKLSSEIFLNEIYPKFVNLLEIELKNNF